MRQPMDLSGEQPPVQTTPAKILILDENRDFNRAAGDALANIIAAADVVCATTMQEYTSALNSGDFDVVVVDYDMPETRTLDFLPRLQLRDHEPDVLLVSKCDNVETVKLIAEARHRRYVVRDEHCIESMTQAIRDMLWVRKLQADNERIQAKLTEANYMLDEKNRRLDEFCATIAHDIRGPLSGLILKLDYILDTYDEELNERATGLLKRSLESAERLVGVVQAMYEFAKVGAKATKMELVDLNELVTSVVSDLPVHEGRDVQIGIGELPTVWGNASLLRRIFINLISNAIKYNDKEQVRINVGHAGEFRRAVARYVSVFVEDNGPGIPADEAGVLFDMFARGRGSSSQSQDGLGIGLAVVQKIAELHFGRVELEPAPSGGSKFVVSLPREKVELTTG